MPVRTSTAPAEDPVHHEREAEAQHQLDHDADQRDDEVVLKSVHHTGSVSTVA